MATETVRPGNANLQVKTTDIALCAPCDIIFVALMLTLITFLISNVLNKGEN